MQSRSSGTPCDQSARCSRKASRASSAQCRSSKTSTVGALRGERLEKRRQAVNDSSCEAGSPPAPTSGASRALSQAPVGIVRAGALARAWPPPPRASRTRGCRTPPSRSRRAPRRRSPPRREGSGPGASGRARADPRGSRRARRRAGSCPRPARPRSSRAGRSAAAPRARRCRSGAASPARGRRAASRACG